MDFLASRVRLSRLDSTVKSLLKVQIGPVQDFIAAARSTRDLWSGSYLLSWLVAAGIRKLPKGGEELVFPAPKGQRLLDSPESWKRLTGYPNKELLTPNLTNLFVAETAVENPEQLALEVVSAIKYEWLQIAAKSREMLIEKGILRATQGSDFDAQAAAFLSVSWQITPLVSNYREAFERNARDLDAVRQTREFHAYPIPGSGEKDSLSSKDLALVGGTDFQKKMAARSDYFSKLFKHADQLSAITLIKRVWHLAFLDKVYQINTGSEPEHFPIRSTHAIAIRDLETAEEESPDSEEGEGEKYLAAIAFDGDSIGKWISGHFHDPTDPESLRDFHHLFSGCLSDFALRKVRTIVEETKANQTAPEGFLIYSGGDDVVALTAADCALDIAESLRSAFIDATDGVKGINGSSSSKEQVRPEASAGIAIAHFKAPLQDLIRAAQDAEQDAKIKVGRPAFSVSLMKRSGAISQWGANWTSGALELYRAIFGAMKNGSLSARFPHRLCQLIEPYLTRRTGISKQVIATDFDAVGVMAEEFRHAATRQGSSEIAQALKPLLLAYLNNLATKRKEEEEKNPDQVFKDSIQQVQLTAIIGLCTTLAFAFRSLPKAERQPIT